MMKGYVCKVCGYISINGRAPAFSEKDNAINTIANPANKTDAEKKHVPSVVILRKCGLIPDGCIDAHVKVGDVLHPMQKEHFIGHIDFYIDNELVKRSTLLPDKINPAAALHIKAQSGKLTVIEWCNLHGAWINEVKF